VESRTGAVCTLEVAPDHRNVIDDKAEPSLWVYGRVVYQPHMYDSERWHEFPRRKMLRYWEEKWTN
jgi:hypothetical protein